MKEFYSIIGTLMILSAAHSFVVQNPQPLSQSQWKQFANADDLEDETPQERDERMKLVRQIQDSFYMDETDSDMVVMENATFQNVPLFRVASTYSRRT